MTLETRVTYNLQLTPTEFRIISAALLGQLDEKGLKEQAIELQEYLFVERAKQIKSISDNILKGAFKKEPDSA